MGAGRAVGLLLVVLLTMPGARAKCGEREYFHEGFCCEFCEAGTFVADHCNYSHSRGKCDPCKEGKGFTAHANGLEECLPCRQCKEGQITLRPCTLTQDAECQCKPGYSCPDEDCEICQRNSQMHPDGKEVVPNSTDSTDPALPSQGKEALGWVIPLIVVAVVVVFFGLGFLFVKKLKCNRAASADEEGGWIPGRMSSCDATSCDSYKKKRVENSVVSEQGTVPCRSWKCCTTAWLRRIARSSLVAKPVQNSAFQKNALSNVPSGTPANCRVREASQIIVKELSQNELTETFDAFIKEVPPQQWKQLMKTVLQENDINEIISKFPNNREEQSYQMLLFWRNRLGQKQCIIKLLDALSHVDTKAYYNISNTLKSNNIISQVEAED